MSTDRTPKSDKELWRSLAPARAVVPMAVSELELAAWLEGRLSEAESARVEAAVAADAELCRAALDLADILGKPLLAPPSRMTVRAQALVGFEVERRDVRGGSWFGGLLSLGAVLGVPRAAMATAAVVIAISGFMLGGGLGESFAAQRYGAGTAVQTTDTANELTSFFATDGI